MADDALFEFLHMEMVSLVYKDHASMNKVASKLGSLIPNHNIVSSLHMRMLI